MRTAGFNSIDLARVAPATWTLMILLMFVGGSPGSTAGGAKTTTLAVVVLSILAVARGRERIEIFGRTLPNVGLGVGPAAGPAAGLAERLLGNLDHPRWQAVAERCLSCGSCTQVCPTCFCHAVDHGSTVGQPHATIERRWESCFTDDHAYIHGGSLRPTVRDRYRQWLTHKLGSWVSQFGQSGCVGCGRCIAWCPAGIDITEEAAAIRAASSEEGHRQ